MSAPTEKEIEALKKFRPLIADLELNEEQQSDMFLLRWLRARELNLKAAEEMLRKSLIWRKENDMDDILTWEAPKQFQLEFAYDISSVDKEGCPVVTVPYGKWDVRKAVESGQKEIYLRYFDQLCERALQVMREQNKNRPPHLTPITQMTCVWDLDGFSMRQMAAMGTIDATLEGVKRFESNYPEILKTSFSINAPRVFALLFGLIKPLLTARTLAKVQIWGSNANKWKVALLKVIPVDQLLPAYGGTRAVNKEFMAVKGRSTTTTNDDGDEMCVVTVDAGDKLNIDLDVKHPNSTLNWSFKTQDFDIGFSIYYEDNELLAHHDRVDSHIKQQDGSLVCTKPGRYSLSFNNTYSMVRSKTLYYMISVSSPEDSDEEEITSL